MVKDEKHKAKKSNSLKLPLELFFPLWRCIGTDGFIKSPIQRWWKTRSTSLDFNALFTGSGRLDLNQKTSNVRFQSDTTFFLGRGEISMDLDESPYPIALKLWVKHTLNWGSLQSLVNNSSGSVATALLASLGWRAALLTHCCLNNWKIPHPLLFHSHSHNPPLSCSLGCGCFISI